MGFNSEFKGLISLVNAYHYTVQFSVKLMYITQIVVIIPKRVAIIFYKMSNYVRY